MYIVHFSRLFACTAMAQSLVPKNFTIGTLVYMMCDNKLIWFDRNINSSEKLKFNEAWLVWNKCFGFLRLFEPFMNVQ